MMTHDEDNCIGNCVSCQKPLYAGDKGYRYSDEIACAECAPTWEEAEDNFRIDDGVDPDDALAFEERYAAHLAQGGTITEQIIEVL